jgi:hypothetical protein
MKIYKYIPMYLCENRWLFMLKLHGCLINLRWGGNIEKNWRKPFEKDVWKRSKI